MSTKMVSIARDDLKIAQPAIHFIDELLCDSYGIRAYFNFAALSAHSVKRPPKIRMLCLACAGAVDCRLVPPPVMTVEIHDGAGRRIAYGKDLEATQDSPICLLHKDGDAVTRHDLWPDQRHIGLPVLLPGSEVGILQSWWHADDQTSWRWQVEFYNEV
jgi:hypothetical protein